MKVTWTQEALECLEDIRDYLAVQEKSPQAAIDTLNSIFSRESQIQDMPHSGRSVPEYNQTNLREIIDGSYRIIYLICESEIFVLTVVHQSRIKWQIVKPI